MQTIISLNILQNVLRPIISVIYFLAIVPTIFRLVYRAWVRQLWWDDMWAGFSMVNVTLLFSTYLHSTFHFMDVTSASYTDFIYMSTLITANMSLWAARLSVAVTIVRVIATGSTGQLVSKIMTVTFGLFSIGLLVQKVIICGPPSSGRFLCTNPTLTGYSELVTSLLADAWLLGAPAYLLWKMNLRKRHHRLLQAIFACEIFVLAASIVHCVYLARQDYLLQAITAHFEIGISLFVCNLLFLVTYIYRIFCHGGETGDEVSTTAPSRHTGLQGSSQNSNVASIVLTSPLTSINMSEISGSGAFNSVVIASDPGPGVLTQQPGIEKRQVYSV